MSAQKPPSNNLPDPDDWLKETTKTIAILVLIYVGLSEVTMHLWSAEPFMRSLPVYGTQGFLLGVLAVIAFTDYRILRAARRHFDESQTGKRHAARQAELDKRASDLTEREQAIDAIIEQRARETLSAHDARIAANLQELEDRERALTAREEEARLALQKAQAAAERARKAEASAGAMLEEAAYEREQAEQLRTRAAEDQRRAAETARNTQSHLGELRALCGYTVERVADHLAKHPDLVRVILEHSEKMKA